MHSKRIIIVLCVLTLLLSIVLGGAAGYLTANIQRTSESLSQNPEESSQPEATSATEAALSVANVAQQCTKSVVNITVKGTATEHTGGSAYEETVIGHGTGVIIRKDGYIVTCHHVIDGADSIYVTLNDQTEHQATLVGFDERFDLAVIHVNKTDMPAATLGDSDKISAGEGVVIIGNPLGEFGSSVSSGVLSAPSRELTISGTPLRLMQTDAAVNPGNSGGGMFNMRGELIAIVNAKISASGIEGIGFAIPLNSIQEKINAIISSGSTGKSAFLGASTKQAICTIDGKNVECLEITAIRENSAAATAGLKIGDYLLSADGKDLKTNDDLTVIIKYHAVGDSITFKVYRQSNTQSITVILGEN